MVADVNRPWKVGDHPKGAIERAEYLIDTGQIYTADLKHPVLDATEKMIREGTRVTDGEFLGTVTAIRDREDKPPEVVVKFDGGGTFTFDITRDLRKWHTDPYLWECEDLVVVTWTD